MTKKQFILEMYTGRNIYGDLRLPDARRSNSLLIFCHGFKGFKDWGGWQYAFDKFSTAGYSVISFNFSHNGIGQDLQNFTELDLFAENTIGKEIEDLKFVLDRIEHDPAFYEIDWKPDIGLIGHSRGAPTVILSANGDDRINALATWSGLAGWDRYFSMKPEWQKNGFIEQLNARTNQMMRMNYGFLEDLEKNIVGRNVLAAESGLKIPHLILHGSKDEAVSPDDAEKLFNNSNKETSRLDTISGGTHTFGQVHPYTGSNPYFEEVIGKTIAWFDENLNK